jgi:L-lactate utilization protein LutB
MTDPCINCKDEKGGCQRTCPIGIAKQKRLREKREKARAEQIKESRFSVYKFDRIHDTMKRAGME